MGHGRSARHVGERLSYPTETITAGTAAELAGKEFDSLAVVLAENPAPVRRSHNSPGIPDEEFLRGEAPMTKEEVRTLAVSKLRLQPHHTVWDVGAGTGSVSVECALAVPAGRVFAIERKDEAVELLKPTGRSSAPPTSTSCPAWRRKPSKTCPPPTGCSWGARRAIWKKF